MNRFIAGTSVLAVLLAVSCMKKPDFANDDGPVAQVAEVQNALIDAWGEPDPLTIDKGEFSYIETSQTIAELPAVTRQQDTKTVVGVVDQPDKKIFDILQRTVEIISDSEQREFSSHLDPISAPKATAERLTEQAKNQTRAMAQGDLSALAATALPLPHNTMNALLCFCTQGLCGNVSDWKPSCHNLEALRETVPAPPLVAAQTNCGGLPNCEIRKNVVRFDIILEDKDPQTNATVRSKSRITVKFSTDVPYLSHLTDYCTESLVPIQNQRIPVRICQSLKNFQRGSP